MEQRKRILIGCPFYRMYIVGSYACDAAGCYRLRADGEMDIHSARCGQRGGQCNETLCFLHRYNKRGKGTWYPTAILADRDPGETTPTSPRRQPVENDLF